LTQGKFVGFLSLAAFAVFLSCSHSSSTSATAATKPDKTRKSAPEFELKDANGASVKLSAYHGKVVLLNFWATWCGPCQLEIPWFVEFEQQYKAQGFEVVGVSMDDDGWTVVKQYITEKKVNYRILLGNDSVTQLYGGVDSLPTTFMIDREGRIAAVHIGLAGKNEYLDEIKSLLDTKQQAIDRSRIVRAMPAALFTGAAE
jgi:peroxiredoxin